MFERFTYPTRAVIVEAQGVARQLGSSQLDVGHLLYVLAQAGEGETCEPTAGRPLHEAGITSAVVRARLPRAEHPLPGPVDPDALRAIGIDYDRVRDAVEKTFGPGALNSAADRRRQDRRIRRPRFSAGAKDALQLGLRTAVELHHPRIEPGHLLLGLLRLDDDFVSATIIQSQIDVATLEAAVLTRLTTAA